MKTVQFLSNSKKIDNIIKGLNLTKSLFVSSILIGEEYIGKKSLVRSLFPNTPFIDAKDYNNLIEVLNRSNEIIIYNFETINSIDRLNFENKRVIAIANYIKNSSIIEKKFAFIYYMPSIKERIEDIELLTKHFLQEIKKELLIDDNLDIKIDFKDIDLSKNIKSMKAYIYKNVIFQTLNKDDIEKMLYNYLFDNIKGNNAYRELLELFEVPLLKAGLNRYKSQLKLSSVLGLNRNTLRKKIYEYNIN